MAINRLHLPEIESAAPGELNLPIGEAFSFFPENPLKPFRPENNNSNTFPCPECK
jgi:hypothetical protein